jgi:SepF-like predicted cell division protein (DUF552 family)
MLNCPNSVCFFREILLPYLGIFHRQKSVEVTKMEHNVASTPNPNSETPKPESQETQTAAPASEPENQPTTTPAATESKPKEETKTYLKAMPLKDLADLAEVKKEVQNGNIIILKITPLANKNIVDVSRAVNELYEFAETIQGDIARLGEERIVICPPKIRIWREKKPAQNEPLPTAA